MAGRSLTPILGTIESMVKYLSRPCQWRTLDRWASLWVSSVHGWWGEVDAPNYLTLLKWTHHNFTTSRFVSSRETDYAGPETCIPDGRRELHKSLVEYTRVHSIAQEIIPNLSQITYYNTSLSIYNPISTQLLQLTNN